MTHIHLVLSIQNVRIRTLNLQLRIEQDLPYGTLDEAVLNCVGK